MDTLRVELGVGVRPVTACVVVSWGFHAALVRDSEVLRPWMGTSRFTVVGMKQLVTFVPEPCDVHFVGKAYRQR